MFCFIGFSSFSDNNKWCWFVLTEYLINYWENPNRWSNLLIEWTICLFRALCIILWFKVFFTTHFSMKFPYKILGVCLTDQKNQKKCTPSETAHIHNKQIIRSTTKEVNISIAKLRKSTQNSTKKIKYSNDIKLRTIKKNL